MPKRTLIAISALAITFAYLVDRGRDSDADPARGPLFGTPCDFKVVAARIPVHSGPDSSSPVIGELTADMVVGAHRDQVDGYRRLGEDRWVMQKALRHTGGERCL